MTPDATATAAVATSTAVARLVVSGLLSLAAAMGIGRFAFTPMLPLMQHEGAVTLAQGAWLAAANYLGYLVGALVSYARVPAPVKAIRLGLLAVAISTAAMALAADFSVWLALRFAAGVASACVLVGVSSAAMAALTAAARADLVGWVFAGVGVGIVGAGALTLCAGLQGWHTTTVWVWLGAAALAVAVGGWAVWAQPVVQRALPQMAPPPELDARAWTLVVAYGGFGLGYIIPATFLPAMARAIVTDPLVYGWAWPVFGAAAALSTIAVSRYLARLAPHLVFALSLLVMAVGVALPVLSASLAAIVISALCVGGTFMVATMAGFQHAKRITTGTPARLIAAMTAAFALGQLTGPLLVWVWSGQSDPVLLPSLIAAAVLLVSAAMAGLARERRR